MIVLAVGPVVLALFPAWNQFNSTNCGGNNAARNVVQCYAIIAQNAADESASGEFLVTSATPMQLKQLSQIARDPWLRGGQLLVSTTPYRLAPSEPRRLIVVFDRPFRNVPRYVFGEAPPTHVAGYSDGSTALLTVKEFAALDRSTLIPLSEIVLQSD